MLFNTSVQDVYGLSRKSDKSIPKDAVGIEIEMEHASPFDYNKLDLTGWNMKTDGSLRNYGLELVSEPFSIQRIGDYVGKTWAQAVKDPLMKGLNHECPRASVHVHVNVKHFTYNQLMNVITAYGLLEGVLIEFCGKYRKGNLFALAIPEAPGNFNVVRSAIKSYTRISVNSDNRYSALNLCSMSRFGTLEFRMLGSAYSPEVIQMWATGLRQMVDHAAYKFKNPPAVYDQYVHASREEFVKEFLGDLGSEILKKPLSDDLFEHGEDAVVSLLACSPDDWTYEKDFRLDEDYAKYMKSELGYTVSQIMSLHSRNYLDWKRSKERSATPRIRPRSGGGVDWEPVEEAQFLDEPELDQPPNAAADLTRAFQFSVAQAVRSRAPLPPRTRNVEDYFQPEDSLPRGQRTIRWVGLLPERAFFNREDYNNYVRMTGTEGEPAARIAFDTRSLIVDRWVTQVLREWAALQMDEDERRSQNPANTLNVGDILGGTTATTTTAAPTGASSLPSWMTEFEAAPPVTRPTRRTR